MDEKLKEFVERGGLNNQETVTWNKEMIFGFAYAVAAFWEKRVLEELRGLRGDWTRKYVQEFMRGCTKSEEEKLKHFLGWVIDQRLAGIESGKKNAKSAE